MANSYKHRSGDRKDGRLLRSLPAISKFIPYFLRDRGSSGILYEEDLDVTAADKCLRQERVNGYKNIGFLHFFIAAYIRCISMLPGLNRFIVGRRVFARDEIDIVLTVKRSETLESSDTRVKIRFEATARGEKPGTVTTMNKKDADRIVRSIEEAKRQADFVFVSHHSHERKGMAKNRPADFCRDFAKLCIDAGATAYIGHGPHIWRGIEIYKDKPVFYSLGDFIFQNDSVERQPTEFYDLYDLGPDNTVADGLDSRSANGTRGLAVDHFVFESALASFTVTEGAIREVDLQPLSLGFKNGRSLRGRPELADAKYGEQILADIADLSKEYGTTIQIADGKGKIVI